MAPTSQFNKMIKMAIERQDHKIAAGQYKLSLLFANGPGTGEGTRALDVVLHVPGNKQPTTKRITVHESQPTGSQTDGVCREVDLELTEPGVPSVELRPVRGKLQISGLILEATQ